MAHKFKVVVKQGTNKDGSPSKTKKTYTVLDRTRSGTYDCGSTPKKSEVQGIIDKVRGAWQAQHLINHPNDKAFLAKHPGIEA